MSRFLCLVILLLAALSALPAAAQTTGAALALSDLTLPPGGSGTIEARLTCPAQCGLVAVTLTYNAEVVRVDRVTPGPALGDLSAGETAVLQRTIEPGRITYIAVAVGFPTPPDTLAFTLDVTGMGVGFTQLAPTALVFGDLQAQEVFGAISGGAITVGELATPTPVATETPAGDVATPAPDVTPTAVVSASGDCLVQSSINPASIHVGPSANRTIRSSLPLNIQAPVSGQTTDDQGNIWWRIQPPGFLETEADRYWVAEATVDEIGDCASVPQVQGSAIISGGGGGGRTFSHTFVSGERQFVHAVPLGAQGRYTMTCAGNPVYPFFAFGGVQSGGQTSVTINAGGTVQLLVSQTTTNAGRTINISSYTCTLTGG